MNAQELEPLRHQVVEIPRVVPDVTEYVLGRRRCEVCNTVTTAHLPRGVPLGMCGPRLSSLIVLLTGVYHLSRRNAAALLQDVLGVELSLGSVSNVEGKMTVVLGAAHEEALTCVRRARVKHLDATSWSRAGEACSLWTFASRLATAFMITAGATAETVKSVVGGLHGTLVSDRGSQFGFWALGGHLKCGQSWPPEKRPVERVLETGGRCSRGSGGLTRGWRAEGRSWRALGGLSLVSGGRG